MIPALILILAAALYRTAMGLASASSPIWLLNFSPLAAIAFCGALYFPPKLKFAVPLLALLISDIVLDRHYGVPFFTAVSLCNYVALILVGCVGLALRNRQRIGPILLGSVAGSIIFYLVTNTFCWLSDPGYAKSGAGLVQALTVGLPAYSATPTWIFFRNSLLSDSFFTFLFVGCMSFSRAGQPSPIHVGVTTEG